MVSLPMDRAIAGTPSSVTAVPAAMAAASLAVFTASSSCFLYQTHSIKIHKEKNGSEPAKKGQVNQPTTN
jgi:hypothetical protein